MKPIWLFLICYGLLYLAGCAESQKGEQVKEIYLTGVSRQRAMEISGDVLRDFNFSVAKEDVNTGYIRARPLPGGQFFEFWRKDNVGSYEVLESNIQSIRRTAELKMSETDGRLGINCEVKVQRLHVLELNGENTGVKYDRITGRRIRTTSLSLDLEQQQITWIDLPDDLRLAAAILKKIEAIAVK